VEFEPSALLVMISVRVDHTLAFVVRTGHFRSLGFARGKQKGEGCCKKRTVAKGQDACEKRVVVGVRRGLFRQQPPFPCNDPFLFVITSEAEGSAVFFIGATRS
jgi:hypothetical protein